MPGMGGEELAEIAVTLRPGIRVVFTSGFQTRPGNAGKAGGCVLRGKRG
jgi:hypothetical protein